MLQVINSFLQAVSLSGSLLSLGPRSTELLTHTLVLGLGRLKLSITVSVSFVTRREQRSGHTTT